MKKAPLLFLICLLATLFMASVPAFAFDIADSEDNMVQIVDPPADDNADVSIVEPEDSGTSVSDASKTNPSTGDPVNTQKILILVSACAACFAVKMYVEKTKNKSKKYS
jgi:hypothetical protein